LHAPTNVSLQIIDVTGIKYLSIVMKSLRISLNLYHTPSHKLYEDKNFKFFRSFIFSII
jgi:hypothetical protein